MSPESKIVPNALKRRLNAGDPCTVFTVRLARTVEVVGIAKASGHDAFYIDLQHNTLSVEAATALCQAGLALGITPLVRVPSHDAGLIGRLLDHGAQGIIAPDVQNGAAAEAVVRCCRFPPRGERSFGGVGPHTGFSAVSMGEAQRGLDAETLVICMIESPTAVAQVDAIAGTDGVDALFVGSGDLTAAMGIPGQFTHERLQQAYRQMLDACGRHGKQLMVGGIKNPQIMAMYRRMGTARCYFTGSDTAFLLDGASRVAAAFRTMDQAMG
jgi:2-keto-3-deoxy-L-rhamnonate aldolase RhmA